MSDEQSELDAARRRVAELEARLAAKREAEAKTVRPDQTVTEHSTSKIPLIVCGVGVVGVFAAIVMFAGPPAGSNNPPDLPVNTDWKAEAEAMKPIGDVDLPPADPWSYIDLPDPVRGKTGGQACSTSTDLVRLDWPYSAQATQLCVRQSPSFGTDVYLRLSEGGQFVCRSYSNCTVKVRFDKGQPISFSAAEAADGSSDVIFMVRAAGFIERLKAAKTVRIEAQYYQAGNQVSTFDTSGLDMDRIRIRTDE
ncbi:MAG: hypothetical protein GC145_06105 [Caulobacter sp.]|nr:hypothetical protein [Caulobacter sp.]